MLRRGLESYALEAEQSNQPFLAELYGASVTGRVISGCRAGQKAVRVGDPENDHVLQDTASPRCVNVEGVVLHANTAIPALDRMRLERMCRYMLRPQIAIKRLKFLSDGRLLYRLKKQWRDGTTHIIFEQHERMERLAALVPAPRFNLIRYSGVLAPSSSWRRYIVPKEATTESETIAKETAKEIETANEKQSRPRRHAWADLLKRVFAVDALKCDRCGGRMKILCTVNPPDAIRKILECIGLQIRLPPKSPALIRYE